MDAALSDFAEEPGSALSCIKSDLRPSPSLSSDVVQARDRLFARWASMSDGRAWRGSRVRVFSANHGRINALDAADALAQLENDAFLAEDLLKSLVMIR